MWERESNDIGVAHLVVLNCIPYARCIEWVSPLTRSPDFVRVENMEGWFPRWVGISPVPGLTVRTICTFLSGDCDYAGCVQGGYRP